MLMRVEVTNMHGETLVLPLQNVFEGFVIQDIEGLDPVPANIVSTSYAKLDGEQYQASRREKRNIVLKLGLDISLYTSGRTVKQLRNRLYNYLMPKSEVRMRFFDSDGTHVDIHGRVEDLKSPLFVKDPEATVSILCLNPDFYVPEPVLIEGLTVSDDTEFLIDYEGTVDTGLVVSVTMGRDSPVSTAERITLYHRSAIGVTQSLEFSSEVLRDDVIKISTISGDKYAVIIREGVEIPMLYGVSTYSSWLNLTPGENYFRVHKDGTPIPFAIEYTTKIGGL